MYIAGLWRYPVKSLAGEALTTAQLIGDGISGDRIVHVAGPHGPLTGRTRHRLLTVPAVTGPDGVPRVAGHPWHTPEAARAVRAAAGPQARLAAYRGPERFDILNLLVATDGALAEFGADVRRLRPNLLIGDVPADAELQWPGHALVIGTPSSGSTPCGSESAVAPRKGASSRGISTGRSSGPHVPDAARRLGRGPGGHSEREWGLAHMPGMDSISSTSMELPGMLR